MSTFVAVEFRVADVEPTGRQEIYEAENLEEAVAKCLYTRKLTNGNACLGTTKSVVRVGHTAWSVVPEKKTQKTSLNAM